VTFTSPRTAPLESATRPNMRPPVLCAETGVEQIRQRPKMTSHRVIQIVLDDGMEQILQTREGRDFY
jgi:hypothetical protein